ncbi:MAG: site-specific integrase, partial [Actinobacteria bacterium]|nr:site-specific integrase [Actinomycetota bacterium]
LSKMFNLAERWGYRPDGTNPCRHVEKFPEDKRQRFLSSRELHLLARALQTLESKKPESEPWPGLLAIRLLLFTGARLGEILSLKWEWVDFERKVIRLPFSKTGAREVPLGDEALALLRGAQRVDGNPYVIPSLRRPGRHLTDLHGPWQRVKAQIEELATEEAVKNKLAPEDRLSFENVRIHDLRHTFASYGAGASMGLPVIGAILGHTQASTTQRYSHVASDPLVAAATSIGSLLKAAMEGEKEDAKGEPSAETDQGATGGE